MENRWASEGGEETKQKTSGGLSRVGAEFRRTVRSEDAGTLQACDESAEALESSSGRDDSLGGWQHGESPNPLRTLSGGQPQRTLLGGQLRRSGPSGKLVWRSTRKNPFLEVNHGAWRTLKQGSGTLAGILENGHGTLRGDLRYKICKNNRTVSTKRLTCYFLIHLDTIHQFSIPASSVQGQGGTGARNLQNFMGERRCTPWTGRQSIAGQHRDTQPSTHSFTPKGKLERPVNLTVMFLDCGRKPSTWREPMHAQGELGVEHKTFLLQGNRATNCATMWPHPDTIQTLKIMV
ncbi:hypothetical protein ATANTOWER_016050 [Ataeniobius toweri]|uniref:Uncharacterized protein n=1 Tax=Ataeniobius toweri TaxID=208326 RepID=A0ABU7C2Q0_9TELE|nr:hypothetical protein [Ataeniobius toweri]